jgi:hypothetical protein
MFPKLASLFGFFLITATLPGQAGSTPVRPPLASQGNSSTKLSLTTDYLHRRIDVTDTFRRASWIRLSVTLDKGVSGKGTLEIDPNTQVYNDFGDPTGVTEIATHRVDITVEVANLDDPAKKGRRLYEIKGKELTTRLFLVVSPPEAGPNRLIVGDKDGNVKCVFPLKDTGK